MTKLKTEYDATLEVWFAYDGDTRDNSRALGQGTTPEDARSDFWYQVNGEAADLYYQDETECWVLRQGPWHGLTFDSKEAAIAYADNHEWQVKTLGV